MGIAPSTSLPKRTEGEELVHSLRNAIASVHYGLECLKAERTDENHFTATLKAITDKLNVVNQLLAQAARLLEADRDDIKTS